MTTINRTIETEHDRAMAARLIEARAVPFTFTLTDGKHRTTAQNKLQRLWMNEIAQQKGDLTPEEARAYCKLTIGVPILRAQNEAFRIRYDEVVKPLPYEQKIAIMSEPLDLPVTRIMTTKQKTEYLDGIIRHFAEQGIVLTMPDDPSGVIPPSSDVQGSDGEPVNTPVPNAVAAGESSPASGGPEEAGEPEAADGQSAAPASVLSPDDKAFLVRVFKTMKAAVGPELNVFKRQALVFTDEIGGKSDLVRAKAKTIREQLQECCGAEPAKGTVAVAKYIAGIIGVDAKELD